jgi:glycosyltransferase involved in cell wall biosynthesis
MNIIVFTNILEGHHLEYIHHIYKMAKDDVDKNYLFVIPKTFLEIKDKFVWSVANHISFDLFDEREVNRKGILKTSFSICRYIKLIAKKYDAEIIYTNQIISFVPFAPLLIRKKSKIVGIIYRIYLHDIGIRSKWSLFQDKLKYWIMSKFSVFYRVMILNDEEGARQLNKIYKTNKFVPIQDPYVPIPTDNLENVRQGYAIGDDKVLFIHFGAMNGNKGTIELLESLKSLPFSEGQKYAFFFAGKVADSIRERFYALVEEVKDKVQIIVKDEYCSYDFFASLCTACDAVVTPYKRTAQSSGLIGYASQFGKPVIAPDKGLLGQLVKKYDLGILIKDITPNSLISAYKKISDGDYRKPTKRYCEDNTIQKFQEIIAKCFNT